MASFCTETGLTDSSNATERFQEENRLSRVSFVGEVDSSPLHGLFKIRLEIWLFWGPRLSKVKSVRLNEMESLWRGMKRRIFN